MLLLLALTCACVTFEAACCSRLLLLLLLLLLVIVVGSAAAPAPAAALLRFGVRQQWWQLHLQPQLLVLMLVLVLLLLAVELTHQLPPHCHLPHLCITDTLAAATVVPHVLLTPLAAALLCSQLAGKLAGGFLQVGALQAAGVLQAAGAPGSH
jgi:hypothetical protein